MPSVSTSLFSNEKSKIEQSESPEGGLLIKFTGTIDHPNPGEFMDPLLEKVHTDALAQQASEVVADFSELGFLNSSGIKSLIKWVMKQMELSADQRYPIKFLYSTKVTWQQTSLKAITVMARGLVTIQPV
jgi:hypothetical protein